MRGSRRAFDHTSRNARSKATDHKTFKSCMLTLENPIQQLIILPNIDLCKKQNKRLIRKCKDESQRPEC